MRKVSGIGIVNYGAGNIGSVQNALEKLGYASKILDSAAQAKNCKVLFLPGVGSFAHSMHNLVQSDFDSAIKEAAGAGTRIIGICLGMQMLADRSEEGGLTAGLGLIPGEVISHPMGLQVGWKEVGSVATDNGEISDSLRFYFNHSFHFACDNEWVTHRVNEADNQYVACVSKDNVIGIQFHPEKSQTEGIELLGRAIRGEPL